MNNEVKELPLGVISVEIWHRDRLKELNRAISEYTQDNREINPLWIIERQAILELMLEEKITRSSATDLNYHFSSVYNFVKHMKVDSIIAELNKKVPRLMKRLKKDDVSSLFSLLIKMAQV